MGVGGDIKSKNEGKWKESVKKYMWEGATDEGMYRTC